MIDVIIRAGLYDEGYVLQHTNGPFLVRLANGKLLRASGLSSEGAGQNYVVWDEASNRPRVIAPHVHCPDDIKPALAGGYKPGGIACKPAFQLLAELASEHSPEKAAQISGVPAEEF